MKKLMTALAVCAIASLSLASGGVTSANVVGYQTVPTTGGNYNLLAINWELVGGGSINIQDLFGGSTNGLVAAGGVTGADNIKVWNPNTSGYKDYYLYTSGGAYPQWDGKWFDGGVMATATFPKGTAFWLLRRGSGDVNLTVAGQVSTVNSVSFAIKAGNFNQIGNPYPTDLAINSPNLVIDVSKAVAAGGVTGADNIKVWNPSTSGYKDYYLYTSGGAYPQWDGKWFDGGVEATGSIPMGHGAWYLSRATVGNDWTLTITKTY